VAGALGGDDLLELGGGLLHRRSLRRFDSGLPAHLGPSQFLTKRYRTGATVKAQLIRNV
jgi:hypothetical protein